MTWIAPGWELVWELNQDWLLASIRCPRPTAGDTPPVAERVWSLVAANKLCKVVLDLDGLGILFSYTIGQLILLQKRLCGGGGTLRLAGVSDRNREAIHICRLGSHLPCFPTREDAILNRNQVCM
jgi:anti-anti-sigma factor